MTIGSIRGRSIVVFKDILGFTEPRTGLVEGAGVAEIQGRIAGLAAADYLKLADRDDLARDIRKHKKDMLEARQAAIPFYPQIEKGRAAMNLIWRKAPNSLIN